MSISILTATKNNFEQISLLRASLENQSSQDFIWYISAPSSSDTSLNALFGCKLDIKVNTDPDAGIFSALNQLIRELPLSSYYIVSGADDVFAENAVEYFNSLVNSGSALSKLVIYTSNVMRASKLLSPRTRASLYTAGQMKFIASHSIATCIPVSAHTFHGLYDEHYRVAADEKFLLACYLDPKISFRHTSFIAGTIGENGISRYFDLDLHIESLRAKSFSLNKKFLALIYSIKFLKYFLN